MKQLTFLDKLVYILNILVAFLFFISFFGPYISARTFPFLSVLNLAVPILVLANFVFFAYWIIRWKRKWILSGILLLMGFLFMDSFYKYSIKENFDDGLKVMSFNVRDFNKFNWLDDPNLGNEIIKFIKKENPDILCFQEHSRIWYKKLKMYPYRAETPYSTGQSVQSIFSKYPIVNKGSLNFQSTLNNGIFSDIVIENDTIRVYNLHLQSFKITPSVKAVTTEPSDKLYRRLTKSFSMQQDQADLFQEHLGKNPHKKIVCGDFNNNQYSNVYHSIKGDMEDTFLKKGKGFGRTYDFMGYPLRIDFILADKNFEVLSHKNYDVRLSDHYPVMSTLRLKSQ
ncbi:endonuclease/exonuclease/phosphatase family metal-dependent hydrolase [Saonia flava]|uniref:Endonuclease/exonuclease/phosphatase family metal-dependent hydrolase n=1 Tax=Saonia flava TaxID=523696 RepID=A0A846QWA5_9FLAO|nr:endonuclease/exonuclease/phosphatase family protein [Saonia flava]NJB72268.1 endonuclease/exonuclease/phosphatase family metal-dependent hydrolase [Saonia flava]